tara:strand:- start:403 stop:561 length:159 start_codon:yes stop_codon:yes gene_type:complete
MEEIQSNTCEIIKIDKKFVKDIEQLKKKYLEIKEKIYNEIIDEINILIINKK